jgi:2,4-dienoyl-CoA reductase-like NADH-dependent reductase (Old Yellow Enzyme family)
MHFVRFSFRSLQIANHPVMEPLSRSPARLEAAPDALMTTGCSRRATAGMITTEGTSPGLNGHTYANVPDLLERATAEQVLLVKRGEPTAFRRPLLANPHLVPRMLNVAADMTAFHLIGATGRTHGPSAAA